MLQRRFSFQRLYPLAPLGERVRVRGFRCRELTGRIPPHPDPLPQGGEGGGFTRCRKGSVAVEFALIIPVALMILIGIVEVGRAM
jgi:Flp pilus assembly protein TadG